jgi:hypothetical protein
VINIVGFGMLASVFHPFRSSLLGHLPVAHFFTSLAIEMDFEATCMNPNDCAWHGATVSAMLTAEP